MYYGSGTADIIASGRPADDAYALTWWREMTSWPPYWKCDVISEIRLCQSVRIYLKNNCVKFHPNAIWSDGPVGFFEEVAPNKKKKNNNNKMNSNMKSVPDLKWHFENVGMDIVQNYETTNWQCHIFPTATYCTALTSHTLCCHISLVALYEYWMFVGPARIRRSSWRSWISRMQRF